MCVSIQQLVSEFLPISFLKIPCVVQWIHQYLGNLNIIGIVFYSVETRLKIPVGLLAGCFACIPLGIWDFIFTCVRLVTCVLDHLVEQLAGKGHAQQVPRPNRPRPVVRVAFSLRVWLLGLDQLVPG